MTENEKLVLRHVLDDLSEAMGVVRDIAFSPDLPLEMAVWANKVVEIGVVLQVMKGNLEDLQEGIHIGLL